MPRLLLPPPMSADAVSAIAARVGAHALPVLLSVLALLLLVVAGIWRTLRTRTRPRPRPDDAAQHSAPRAARVLVLGAAGLALLLAAAWLFAELAEGLAPGRAMARVDAALTEAIGRDVGIGTLRFFATLTRLGDPAWLVALGAAIALLLWLRSRRVLAAGWVLALAGNAVLNPLLKRIFERIRPLHADGLVSASGYSFPSGHSSGAMVAYGMLAYLALRTLPRRWHLASLLAAAALVYGVGCSRILLRVHYASDVLAGFASGGAWLLVCIASVEGVLRMRRGR